MDLTVASPRRSSVPLFVTVWGSAWRAQVSLVPFACSLLTVTAITPLAARGTRTSSCATTASATSSVASVKKVSCHPCLKSAFCLGRSTRVAGLGMLPYPVGETPKAWPWTWLSPARSPDEISRLSAQRTLTASRSTESTTKVSGGLLTFSVLLFSRQQEATARKPCPSFVSSFALQLDSRTPSSVFTLVELGLGWLVTCKPRLHKPSFIEHPRAVTLFAVTSP